MLRHLWITQSQRPLLVSVELLNQELGERSSLSDLLLVRVELFISLMRAQGDEDLNEQFALDLLYHMAKATRDQRARQGDRGPTPTIEVGDFLKDEQFSALSRIAVHVGGPVARQHLTFAALWWTPEKGLRFATRLSAHDAVRHTRNSGTLVRAFIGYSGWGAGQLEAELTAGAWFTADVEPDDLFTADPDGLWERVLRRQRGELAWFANFPPTPEVN